MFATSTVEVSLMKWIFEKLPSPVSLYRFTLKFPKVISPSFAFQLSRPHTEVQGGTKVF